MIKIVPLCVGIPAERISCRKRLKNVPAIILSIKTGELRNKYERYPCVAKSRLTSPIYKQPLFMVLILKRLSVISCTLESYEIIDN